MNATTPGPLLPSASTQSDLEGLWRGLPCLLAVIGPDGVLRAVNPAWWRLLGHVQEEVVGRPVSDFIHPHDLESVQHALGRSGEPGGVEFTARWRHVDGHYRQIAWAIARAHDGTVMGAGRDASADLEAARASQSTLRRADKLQAVGRLTGGISHDFNNLLQLLRNTLELMRRRPDDPLRVGRWAESALRVVDSGARLTAQLLAFSSAQQLELHPLVVTELLLRMRGMLEGVLGPSVCLRMEAMPENGIALVDPTQLEMAILNLTLNARDAMPGGGEITLSCERVRLEQDAELATGDYLQIEVRDTGVGMSEAVRERAFEPFFTTKPIGQGSGMGLSQVYGFARQAGGTARIVSDAARGGTSVSLLLPILAAAPVSGPPWPAALDIDVLVVVDDKDARRRLCDGLRLQGYRMVESADGLSAQLALRRHAPGVVVIDRALPEQAAAEVAGQARQARADMGIVFTHAGSESAGREPGARARDQLLDLAALSRSIQQAAAAARS